MNCHLPDWCAIDSKKMQSTSYADKDTKNIWWKLYTLEQSISACNQWRHIPTDLDWIQLETFINGNKCRNKEEKWWCEGLWWAGVDLNKNIVNILKIPYSGRRYNDSNLYYFRWFSTTLWSWTKSINWWIWRYFDSQDKRIFKYNYEKNYGFSVRCIKDLY